MLYDLARSLAWLTPELGTYRNGKQPCSGTVGEMGLTRTGPNLNTGLGSEIGVPLNTGRGKRSKRTRQRFYLRETEPMLFKARSGSMPWSRCGLSTESGATKR